MSYEAIRVEVDEFIGTITLNRPENLNTFNTPLAREFAQALQELEDDQQVRVVVVKGEGKAFCAGIDITELEGKEAVDYYAWVQQMEEMSLIISRMGTPVIASVQDLAVANGIGVVASADLAIAAEGARFGATAVNVGLFCMGPAVPLARNLGRKKALELVLTGDMIDADEAYRIGLINKIVPKDELEAATQKMAAKIAAKSPLAVQMGKKSFYRMEDLDYASAFEMANNHFALLCSTQDAHEGVSAFLNKRSPEWKGR
ncbi:enoyl-CoA hydratase/isomerase family protein [Desulfovermiculus halophilus]|uniref:enoyl-CoA hydratase/isomerase family protein n=1 Tax=Desulfovermiculus halophilus TaxID=339722 RepID=UPI000483080B|nr:enoyl-CoA hydratase-related protein [Desulfovermiculus halophilus]